MTLRRLLPALLALALAGTAGANEKILKDAIRQDQTMDDITGRIGRIAQRQANSNVFESREIATTEKTRTDLSDVRQGHMQTVIGQLSQAVNQGGELSAEGSRMVRENYQGVIAALARVRQQRGEDLQKKRELRELLEAQKRLREETEKATQNKDKNAQLQKFAELAEKQEQVANATPDEKLKANMDKAEDALAKMDAKQALEHQDNALKQLQQMLKDEATEQKADEATQAMIDALTDRIEQMKATDEKLASAEDQLKGADQQKPDEAVKQEAGQKLDEAKAELAKQDLQPAAQAAEAANQQLQQDQVPQATQKTQEARAQLQQALAEAQKQLEQVEQAQQQLAQMQALDQQLQNLEGKLDTKQPPSAEFKQDMAMQMDNAAQKLEEQKLDKAAQNMQQAMQQTMAENLPQAKAEVKQARNQVQQQMQQMQQQMAQMQQQMQPQPQSTPSKEEDKPRQGSDTVVKDVKKREGTPGGWQAQLPAHERQALLAARQARYNDKWEDEVKRYFVELAR